MLHEINNIQRAFLWKGEEHKRMINLVLWRDICKFKCEYGFVIKMGVETLF